MIKRTVQAVLFGLLLTVISVARALPEDDSHAAVPQDAPVADGRAVDVERHVSRRGNSVRFGKTTETIVGYATVPSRHSATVTKASTLRRKQEETRYALEADVKTIDGATAHVEAQVHEFEWSSDEISAGSVLLEATTGIDVVPTLFVAGERTLTATIATSYAADAQWTMRLETVVNRPNSAWHRRGELLGGGRSIDIVGDTDSEQDAWRSRFGIEFFEDGSWIGAIAWDNRENYYEFRSNLDPELKLVLAAAMEAISFRFAWY